MKDITPELIQKIKNEFDKKIKGSNKIKELEDILKSGESNYMIANDYAIEVGYILATIFKNNISSDILPDGRMYYNIADRLLNDRLKENYNLISDYAVKTQTALNNQAKLNINGIKPKINQSRIDGIIERLSNEDNFDSISWILDEPVKNFSQSIVDDTIKINVEHHYKMGLKPKIIRTEVGNCCDWCKSVVGKYDYPNVPKDIYRRHRFCRCTVDYYPGYGKKQNVHSKKWYDPEKDDKIEIRKRHNIQIKDINRKDDREQYKKYMDILGEDRMPKSLSAFQNLKYDNPVEYEKLKDHVFIQNNFNKGIWKDEINIDKQKRHIQSTAGEYKSYFYDDVDVEKLYNEYKMTGRFRQIKGDIKNHEIVDFKETINLGIDIYSGNIANGMTIHYSKTGSHLIPTYHREE